MTELNVVDIFIIIALFTYVLTHAQEGFLVLSRRLVSFFGAAILSFMLYSSLASFFALFITLPPGILEAGSFILAFAFIQFFVDILLGMFISLFPREMHFSPVSKILATIPAFVDGLIITALTLLILVVLPVFPGIKQPIEHSRIGSSLVNQAAGIEIYIDRVFGRATRETLGFLTIRPGDDEMVELPFQAERLSVDEESERRMLALVNRERARVGVVPLIMDETIVSVAREHSTDMWQRAYFAHENLDGETPFDRMRRHGVTFRAAGENLALARTVERAHNGLMNSPGHRRNILDPTFTRAGIGVIDGGIYGKMFTQNFAN